jgi:ADP-heptose:LPS heptosyltransferase
MSPPRMAAIVDALAAGGRAVVVTGGPAERPLTAHVAHRRALDLGGRTGFAELAAVIDRATALVAPNSAAGHLAAAVGTPVVSLFAPVVPAVKWRPYRVPHVLLGDQLAACRGTRARHCPVPRHPCLESVSPENVADAVDSLAAATAGI